MKKISVCIAGLCLAFDVSAAQVTEGQQYISLNKTVHDVPSVLEFFSFNCPHCYQFEQVMHVSSRVAAQLPHDVKIIKYHVDFLPPLGKELSHAWAVAMALGIEDKIESSMFDAVQITRSIHSSADIRQVFIDVGIKPNVYDGAWDSFAVKALVSQQEKAANDVELQGVPAMFVNGKYQINMQGMDTGDMNAFVQEYASTVNALLNKK